MARTIWRLQSSLTPHGLIHCQRGPGEAVREGGKEVGIAMGVFKVWLLFGSYTDVTC